MSRDDRLALRPQLLLPQTSLLLLLLLLLLLPALPITESLQQTNDELLQWLRDPEASREFYEAFGGKMHPLEAVFSASSGNSITPDIDLIQCLADTMHVIDSRSFNALLMKDASVKIPEGLLVGSWTHFGNWDECVSVVQVESPVPKKTFDGQMCIVSIVPATKEKEQRRSADIPMDVRVESENAMGYVALRLSYCVPSSCKSESLETIFSQFLKNITQDTLTAVVNKNDCTTQEKRPLDGHDWAGISILIIFGIVIIASTTYDVVTPNTRKRPLPASFSVISNGRKLLAGPRSGGDQTLSSLHGIRFLSMIWVVVGHRYMYSVIVPSLNPGFAMDVFNNWYYVGLTNATVSVDTFFVLSGLLVAYLFFKQEPSKRHLNLPLYYLHRYIRLTPALAMMVLVQATFLSRIGNGPLWPATFNDGREACKSNWWNVLLYIANYVDPQRQCVGQSWYLMVDMQLHWLSPLLLIPITKFPRIGHLFIYPFMVIGLIINFVLSYVYDYAGNMMGVTDEEESMNFFQYFYIPTYTRFVPYLIGMEFGYIIANQRAEGNKPKPLSRPLTVLGWLCVAASMLVPLMTGFEFIKQPHPSKFLTAVYNALHRPAWSLGVAAVVYLCANGNGGPANTFLSWKGFQFLGRFSYCIYLVHMTVQSVQAGSIRSPLFLSNSAILTQFAADFLISLLLAACLSLLCESPFLVLEKQLLGQKKPENKTPVVTVAPTPLPTPSNYEQQPVKSPEHLI